LARALPAEFERRIWHRAAAAVGPTEEVAAELANAGERLRRRGGIEAAWAALERAAELSPDPRLQGERLVRAAEFASERGRRAAALDLLRQAEPLELSTLERARMATIRDVFDDGIRDVASGTGWLADLAEQVAADGHTDMALRLLLATSTRCYFNEPGPAVRRRVATAAERVCPDDLDPRLLAIFGFVAPIDRGRAILDRLSRSTRESSPNAARMLGVAALAIGAFDVGVALHSRAIGGLRAQGRIALLARSLSAQVWCALHLVDLGVGIPAAEEGVRLARETSQPNIEALGRAHQALIAALRGDQDSMERNAAEAEREGLPVGARPTLAVVAWARGLSALGAGRHADAYEHLCRVHDQADPAYHISHRWSTVGDVVEAAVRSGQGGAIEQLMAELERVARRTPAPALHIGLRYARALVADDADAEALYQTALSADLAGWPFARARAQLGYGEWLRRQRRVAESRGHLRAARETFDALGTGPWADKARHELRASGETSQRRTAVPRDLLTPQELQIAQLAAGGFTNREIGQKLYLSHRTVSTHLHRIFPKVGVTSRSALRAALEPSA
jgi:DNA-binding CsgD family transcriptional regulator